MYGKMIVLEDVVFSENIDSIGTLYDFSRTMS